MPTTETAELLAFEVEINDLYCVAFAATPAKAKWIAVKAYWDAYGTKGVWPSVSIARRPQYDKFPHRKAGSVFSPEYVRDLC